MRAEAMRGYLRLALFALGVLALMAVTSMLQSYEIAPSAAEREESL